MSIGIIVKELKKPWPDDCLHIGEYTNRLRYESK